MADSERLADWLGATYEPFGAHSHYGLVLGEKSYQQVADAIRGFLETNVSPVARRAPRPRLMVARAAAIMPTGLGDRPPALTGPHSSRGPGHRPLKAEITGSNPVCGTNRP